LIASTVFNLVKYGISTGAVSITELLKSETITQCCLSGNLCSISCPQFSSALSKLSDTNELTSVSCIYKKVKHSFLTLGQLYFLNRTFISKQTEDRDFLYRVIVGKPLIEDSDEIIYRPVDAVGKSLDYEMDEMLASAISTTKRISYENNSSIPENKLSSIRDEVTEILKKTFEQKINQTKDELIEKLKISKPTDHIKHILRKLTEGVSGPQYFGMHEYIQIIVDFILNSPKNKYKQYEVLAFLRYIVLAFVSKDTNDFPAIAMTQHQINELILKTKDLSDDHPYKWSSKRKNQIDNQSSRYRKMVYVNDFLYLWKLYVVHTTPIQEITEADIRVKFIIDMLIYKLSFEYSTERIILNKMEDVNFKRLKRILLTIMGIIEEYKMQAFSIYNITDIWLENQIKSQYMINIKTPKHEIEGAAKEKGKRRATPAEVYTYLSQRNNLDTIVLIE